MCDRPSVFEIYNGAVVFLKSVGILSPYWQDQVQDNLKSLEEKVQAEVFRWS